MTEAVSASKPSNDVGSILREARTRKGLTLEAVFHRTRIPRKFLEALEANRFDAFPARVYLQGFLKNYCDHLELEFEPLWKMIAPAPAGTETKSASEPAASSSVAASAPPAAMPSPKPAVRPRRDAPPPARRENWPPIDSNWIFAGVLAVGALALLVWLIRSPKGPPPAPPAPHVPAAVAPLKPSGIMTLKIVFRQEAWVRLRCDGKLRFEGRAPAGFIQQWSAMNEFLLRAPDPKELGLSIDGKEVALSPSMQNASGEYKITR